MATFSERKTQRYIDSIRQLNPTELMELRKRLQTYKPETSNENCGFLDLPAEIRNMIYHYIAADAHASAELRVWNGYSANCAGIGAVQGKDARKIRLGLFGTCREIFREFHGIFYSPAYSKARVLLRNEEWHEVKKSAMLDAIVSEKHLIGFSGFAKSQVEFDASITRRRSYKSLVYGARDIALADGRLAIIGFTIGLISPWVDVRGTRVAEWSMSHSCHDMASTPHVPSKKDRCALCLVSVEPERAASARASYGDYEDLHNWL